MNAIRFFSGSPLFCLHAEVYMVFKRKGGALYFFQ